METGAGATPRRLALLYLVLAIGVAVTLLVTFAKGKDESPQPAIAGTYQATAGSDCLGETFILRQSGQFVTLDNAAGTLGGNLRWRDAQLTGSADCLNGESQDVDAKVSDGKLTGTLGGAPLEAQFTQDAPPAGSRPPVIPDSIAGDYTLSPRSTCLGGALNLSGGSSVAAKAGDAEVGTLTYTDSGGQLTGTVTCTDGQTRAKLTGAASDRTIALTLEAASPSSGSAASSVVLPEKSTATKMRDFGNTVGAFFIAVVAVMLIARAFGAIAVRIAQPRVMGEVVAGLFLGPSVLGAIAPQFQAWLFPVDIIPILGVVANLGLIFYMFLVGLELDMSQLRGRVSQALAISNASVALPLALGVAVALPIYKLLGPDTKFVSFALFMGVAMSITAFPVLARILVERRMLKRPVGALTMAAAAIDDVTAWFLIALATAVAAAAGSTSEVVRTIAEAAAFCVGMFLLIRPVIARVSRAYDEAGRVPSGWIAAIFAGVLLSAYATEQIGIAVIFGAFVMGMVMPRHTGLTEDVTGRIEDFVVTLLLPLFFAYTGLRTNVGLLSGGELWLITALLVAVAVTGKMVGAMGASRLLGFGWRDSTVIGTLMNTRGLTELIVLNLALEAGAISDALFAALVLMALITTFMAGPFLRLLDPKNELGAPVEEEFEEARKASRQSFPQLEVPDHSILLGPQSDGGLSQLLALGEPLARSEPPRELILARLIPPPRAAAAGVRGGLQTENRLLGAASRVVEGAQARLARDGVAARAVAFISTEPGADLNRLAEREDVDLILIDGRRPLLGEGVPRGDVGAVLAGAACDTAVLVASEEARIAPGPGSAVVVPFGGAEHDWAALELGAWIASATEAPLKLLGAAGDSDEPSRVSRLLADAGLVVQQYAGVPAQPVVTEPGREGVLAAAGEAGLLVIGLSPRWRSEGLGSTRSAIARAAPAPIVFIRRGTRPGALAPSEDFTRFTWSAPGMVRDAQ
jgi:Kef-type K+ transport system membrane component KefB